MRILIAFILFTLFVLFACTNNIKSKQQIKGEILDVSPNEDNILYSELDEKGNLDGYENVYLYNIKNKEKKHLFKKLRYYEQSSALFFDNDNIFLFSKDIILIKSTNSTNINDTLLKLKKTENINKSRKLVSDILFSLVDYGNEKLCVFSLGPKEKKIIKLIEYKIDILPTENYFDAFKISDNYFINQNGTFIDLKSKKRYKIEFNDILGKYIIDQTPLSICAVIKENNTKEIILINKDRKYIPNIKLTVNESINIKTVIYNENYCFLVSVGRKYYLLDNNSKVTEISNQIIFKGRKLQINLESTNELFTILY